MSIPTQHPPRKPPPGQVVAGMVLLCLLHGLCLKLWPALLDSRRLPWLGVIQILYAFPLSLAFKQWRLKRLRFGVRLAALLTFLICTLGLGFLLWIGIPPLRFFGAHAG